MLEEVRTTDVCNFCTKKYLLYLSYFKLIISALLLYPISILMVLFLGILQYYHTRFVMISTYTYLFLILTADLGSNILLVKAAQRTSIKMLRICVYYIAGIALLYSIFVILLTVYVLCIKFQDAYIAPTNYVVVEILTMFTTGLAQLTLQTYVLLMVRRSIANLGGNFSFWFIKKEYRLRTMD